MKKIKPKASFLDTRGKLFVDCAECNRGGNGEKDCSAGWRHRTRKRGGCFCGSLLDKYEI